MCEVNNINEEVINANQEFSAEHINIQSQFKWGDLRGEVFMQRINIAYEEIVKWRRNISVTICESGKSLNLRMLHFALYHKQMALYNAYSREY